MDAYQTTFDNLCKGGLKEILARELPKIAENMADPNTRATKARTLTIIITFKPYPDRSGATVHIEPKEGLCGLDASGCDGTVFLAKRDGKYELFSRDVRQELLFQEKDIAPDGKTAGAGE